MPRKKFNAIEGAARREIAPPGAIPSGQSGSVIQGFSVR